MTKVTTGVRVAPPSHSQLCIFACQIDKLIELLLHQHGVRGNIKGKMERTG